MIRVWAVQGDASVLHDLGVQDVPRLLAEPATHIWIDLAGDATPESEHLLREVFRFHPAAIEDCFEARAHPKIEAFDDYVFVITHGLLRGSTAEDADVVELDAFLGKRFLVTHHEQESRSINAAATSMENGGSTLRRGPASVLHAILDRQVDSIEPVLDAVEERVEQLEERVFGRPQRADLATMLALKRTTLQFRRWMSKQREVVLRLSRNEFQLVAGHDAVLFRDVYDHLARFTDLVETHRDMIGSLQETYLSITNLRLAEIMKFLTLFTAVLMPLTVITGIYGMNFEHMPELKSTFGYPAVLGVMAVTSTCILWYFGRKGWIGGDDQPRLKDDEPGPGV